MEEFIKNNMNKVSNYTKIKFNLSNKIDNNIYEFNFNIDKVKYLLNNIDNYNLEYKISNNIEYKYKNYVLKIINNEKSLYSNKIIKIEKLDDGVISLLDNKKENIELLEGLYNYNTINNNQIITININKIIELEISTIDNINYQINIIIPNQNIYYDKIFKIMNDIKNNI